MREQSEAGEGLSRSGAAPVSECGWLWPHRRRGEAAGRAPGGRAPRAAGGALQGSRAQAETQRPAATEPPARLLCEEGGAGFLPHTRHRV